MAIPADPHPLARKKEGSIPLEVETSTPPKISRKFLEKSKNFRILEKRLDKPMFSVYLSFMAKEPYIPPGWLSTVQVARLLGVTRVRVHQLEEAGYLPSMRNNWNWRVFDPTDVNEYLKKREAVRAARAALRRPE